MATVCMSGTGQGATRVKDSLLVRRREEEEGWLGIALWALNGWVEGLAYATGKAYGVGFLWIEFGAMGVWVFTSWKH
jgi:hypothetical protein